MSTTNDLVAGNPQFEDIQDLEEVVRKSYGEDKSSLWRHTHTMKPFDTIILSVVGKSQALFNNAAQAWNHAFYWNCLKKGGGGAPVAGKLLSKISESFGSFEKLRSEVGQLTIRLVSRAFASSYQVVCIALYCRWQRRPIPCSAVAGCGWWPRPQVFKFWKLLALIRPWRAPAWRRCWHLTCGSTHTT